MNYNKMPVFTWVFLLKGHVWNFSKINIIGYYRLLALIKHLFYNINTI